MEDSEQAIFNKASRGESISFQELNILRNMVIRKFEYDTSREYPQINTAENQLELQSIDLFTLAQNTVLRISTSNITAGTYVFEVNVSERLVYI